MERNQTRFVESSDSDNKQLFANAVPESTKKKTKYACCRAFQLRNENWLRDISYLPSKLRPLRPNINFSDNLSAGDIIRRHTCRLASGFIYEIFAGQMEAIVYISNNASTSGTVTSSTN